MGTPPHTAIAVGSSPCFGGGSDGACEECVCESLLLVLRRRWRQCEEEEERGFGTGGEWKIRRWREFGGKMEIAKTCTHLEKTLLFGLPSEYTPLKAKVTKNGMVGGWEEEEK